MALPDPHRALRRSGHVGISRNSTKSVTILGMANRNRPLEIASKGAVVMSNRDLQLATALFTLILVIVALIRLAR